MAEVSELLITVCEAHKLPLAQTWVRCRSCGGGGEDTEKAALTTAGAPFHLAAGADARGFRDACVEHHLQRGQGLVGTAARAPGGGRLCADVARCSKDDYPLAHYAGMYGLAGCLVLRAELSAAAMADAAAATAGDEEDCVVLELFLPPDCTGVAEQKAAVDAVSATIKQCSGNLKAIVISNLDDLFLDTMADGDHQLRHEMDDLGDDQRCSDEEDLQLLENTNIGELNIHNADQIRNEDPTSQVGKNKTKRGKAEKSVTLEELQKHFSGSLKDAARSLGGKTTSHLPTTCI